MTTGADAAARILRGRTLSFGDDPRVVGPERAMRGHEDGAVVIGRGGASCGTALIPTCRESTPGPRASAMTARSSCPD